MIAGLETIVARAVDGIARHGRCLAALRIAYGLWVIVLPVDSSGCLRAPRTSLLLARARFQLHRLDSLAGVPRGAGRSSGSSSRTSRRWRLQPSGSLLLTVTLITASGMSYSFSKVDHFILFRACPGLPRLRGVGSPLVGGRADFSATRGQ